MNNSLGVHLPKMKKKDDYDLAQQHLLQHLFLSLDSLDNKRNEADSPTKTPDTNVKNAASQTGKQTCFIVLLLQAKHSFFTIQILV